MKTAVKNANEQAETNKAAVEDAERTVAEAKNELQRAMDQQKVSLVVSIFEFETSLTCCLYVFASWP